MNKNITIQGTPAYHSYPNDGKKHPGLILIEEIWGVDKHIRSVADRFAAEGFSVIAPELLPRGMLDILTPELFTSLDTAEKRAAAQPKLREAMQPISQPEYAKEAITKLKACADFLAKHEHTDGRIAVLGFCFGGTCSFHLAANDDRIGAVVAFYGQPPTTEEVEAIKCPMLAFYGDQDTGLMETLPKLKTDMKEKGKQFEAVVYPAAGHAFFNDQNVVMYRAEPAKDAWKKALEFLEAQLA